MERNAILATVLVILILLGYQWYVARFEAPQPPGSSTPPPGVSTPPPGVSTPRPTAPIAPPPAAAPAPTLAPAAALPRAYTPTPQAGMAPREVEVETPLMRVVLTTAGARATHWKLNAYRMGNGEFVDLVPPEARASRGPLAAWADPEQIDAIFEVDRTSVRLGPGDQPVRITFSHTSTRGIQLVKTLTFRADRYDVGVSLTTKNLGEYEQVVQPRLTWGPGLRNGQGKDASVLQPPTTWLDGKRHQEDAEKLTGERVLEGTPAWTALQDNYFAAALIPGQEGVKAFVSPGAPKQPVVGLTTAPHNLRAGAQVELLADVFAGPRDLDVLKAVGKQLDQLVDLGWFDFLARPALWLLKFFYTYTGNYGIAIILVTILQKVAFHPLTHKSLKSMQAMQAIQPKVQAIQERYKNNPQKKQEETMALYRKHGVNPMGGCLPMLVQIPIFVALYNALSSSVEMWQAGFLWIRDLTQPDALFHLTVWGGTSMGFNLLALLMGASMWFQQKMSPPMGDPRQAKIMLWMMPILFTWMFWGFPSGLVLYWLVNNVLQIGQQWLITGRPSKPTTPAEAPAT